MHSAARRRRRRLDQEGKVGATAPGQARRFCAEEMNPVVRSADRVVTGGQSWRASVTRTAQAGSINSATSAGFSPADGRCIVGLLGPLVEWRAPEHQGDDRARRAAAGWQARAEQRPASDAAGALSNWHELGVTA